MGEHTPEQLHIGSSTPGRAPLVGGEQPADWQIRPANFLESIGTRMMLGLLVAIVLVTAGLLFSWVAKRPDAASLAGDLRLFPTTQPSALRPEEVVELLSKRQAAYDEAYRGTFQLLVLSGLVPLFTLLAGYGFGKSKA